MNRQFTYCNARTILKGMGVFVLVAARLLYHPAVRAVRADQGGRCAVIVVHGVLGDVQRWPERMVTMTGRMAPCPETRTFPTALDDFEEALGMTTTLLERAMSRTPSSRSGKSRCQACMTSRPRRNGATLLVLDGVAMSIICRNGIQVHADGVGCRNRPAPLQ